MDFLPPPRIDLLVYSPTSSSLLSPLSTLLEPSSSLSHQLVPQLHSHLQTLLQTSPAALPKSYSALLDICAGLVGSWDMEDQASFVNCHPRIGEMNNLSLASSLEQGSSSRGGSVTPPGTPGEVLKRLTVSGSWSGFLCSEWVNRSGWEGLGCLCPAIPDLFDRTWARDFNPLKEIRF